MKNIRIIIADDHTLIAQAWSFLLSQKPGYIVEKIYDNTQTLLEEIQTIRPDILLLDINIRPLNGIETAAFVKKIQPEVLIIGVSMHNEVSFASRMIQSGASAYVTKNSHQEEMFRAIEEVLKGNIYICNEIKTQINYLNH